MEMGRGEEARIGQGDHLYLGTPNRDTIKNRNCLHNMPCNSKFMQYAAAYNTCVVV